MAEHPILTFILVTIGLAIIVTLFVLIVFQLVKRGFMFMYIKSDTIGFGVTGKGLHRSTIHESTSLTFEGSNIRGPEEIYIWEAPLRKYFGIRYLGMLAKSYKFPLQERVWDPVDKEYKWLWQKNPDGSIKMFDNLWTEIPFDLDIALTELSDGLSIKSRFRLKFAPVNPKQMIFTINGKFFENGVDLIEGSMVAKLKAQTIGSVIALVTSGSSSIFTDFLNEEDATGETFLEWFEEQTGYTITEIVLVSWDPANEETRRLLEAGTKADLEGKAALIAAQFANQVRVQQGLGEKSYMESIAAGEKAKIEQLISALGPDATDDMKTAVVLQYLQGTNLPKGITTFLNTGSILDLLKK